MFETTAAKCLTAGGFLLARPAGGECVNTVKNLNCKQLDNYCFNCLKSYCDV